MTKQGIPFYLFFVVPFLASCYSPTSKDDKGGSSRLCAQNCTGGPGTGGDGQPFEGRGVFNGVGRLQPTNLHAAGVGFSFHVSNGNMQVLDGKGNALPGPFEVKRLKDQYAVVSGPFVTFKGLDEKAKQTIVFLKESIAPKGPITDLKTPAATSALDDERTGKAIIILSSVMKFDDTSGPVEAEGAPNNYSFLTRVVSAGDKYEDTTLTLKQASSERLDMFDPQGNLVLNGPGTADETNVLLLSGEAYDSEGSTFPMYSSSAN